MKISYYIKWLAKLLLLILLFALIDYFFHSLTKNWAVPEYYFKNKIIYGFLWSIPALWISSGLSNIYIKSFSFSAIISIVLQIRYYIEGYPLDFVLIFLVIHFLILYILSLIMFAKLNKNYE